MEENRFDNVKKEIQIYIACFIFTGFINIMFWKDFNSIWNDKANEDSKLFIILGAFAAAGSLIGLTIHFIMYLKATKNIRKK